MTARRPPRGGGSRRIWALVALAAFLLVDVALVALALNRTAGLDAPGGSQSASPAAPTPAATEAPAPTALLPATRMITALDANVAWRGEVGACPASEAALELTSDGGATWAPHSLNPPTELRSVLSVDVIDRSEVRVVGQSGEACAIVLGRSYTAGLDWVESPGPLNGMWFVDPANPTLVRSPSETAPAPCGAIVDVAGAGDSGAVLCGDRTVHRTTDGGSTWDAGLAVPGVVALDAGSDGYLLAGIGDEACDGVQLRALPEADSDELSMQGCLPARTKDLAPGSIAVSVAGTAVWLWIDEAVRVSQNGGLTW